MIATEIQIIGRLFEFIGSYKADELMHASDSPLVTANVRAALAALARARAEAPSRPVVEDSTAHSHRNGGSERLRRIEEALFDALARDTSIKSAGDIVRIAARVGIPLPFTAKDGRSRVVSRLRRELHRLPSKQRESKYRQLLRELQPNQTEGWFKLIRGEP
jgi:hypothetical protein